MVGGALDPLPTERASVSALARDLRSGETLVEHAPDRPVPPASNTKLITTAVALDRLDPDYRFETRVHAAGDRDGDLVLVGRGAPDLGIDDLRSLAEYVREAGVRRVEGDLLLDGSWFGPYHYGPGWTVGDRRHGYGAPSTALALARNVVDVTISDPEGTGEFETAVDSDTGVPDLSVNVEVAEAEETALSAETDPETGVVAVSGTLARGESETVSAPVGEPLAHCGAAFREALTDAGVTVVGETRVGQAPTDAELLATHESAPLSEICREMNVPSDNFLAETVARTVVAESRGEGTWDAWADCVGSFLDDRGIEPYRVRDGSGLSRYNLVAARGLVELIEDAAEAEWSEAFLASLPEAGEDGTLASRLEDLDPTVRAKTGSLTGTRALSGVIEDDGEPAIAFSVQLSNLVGELEEGARDSQDEFVRRLTERL